MTNNRWNDNWNNKCPHPGCDLPDEEYYPVGRCVLTEPMGIAIPAGQHIHLSCPVHPPGHILRGSPVRF
jgi:hypothetical protein